MIKAILFDIDNTLIEFRSMKESSTIKAIEAMRKAGLRINKNKALEELYNLYEEHGIENQSIFQKFLRKIEGKVDPKKLAHGIIAYRKKKRELIIPYPNAEEVLTKLKEKGIVLGIVTDAPEIQAWTRIVQTGLDDYFDFVIISGKNHKGTGKPFKKALKQLKLPASQVLHVGDWPDRDLKGAKKHGLKTCFAKYGHSTLQGKPIIKKVKADYTISNLNELLEVIYSKKSNSSL